MVVPPPEKKPRPSASSDGACVDAVAAVSVWDVNDEFTCPCCAGTAKMRLSESPEWLSRVTSPESLYAMLTAIGIDEHAKCQAHLVCQDFGDDGVEGVKGILINCLKNWNFLGNPSAFIASGCIRFVSRAIQHCLPRKK